jgi:RecB family exonuclease
LVGSLDRLEKDAEGRPVVVDLKTAARRYSDLVVEASLQLSVYSYATMMSSRRGWGGSVRTARIRGGVGVWG